MMDGMTSIIGWIAGALLALVFAIRSLLDRRAGKKAGAADEREKNVEEREKHRDKIQQADKDHRASDSDEHRKWLLDRAKARNKSD